MKSPKEIIKPLGINRHFTPAAQEWHNSVYTYNNYYLKTLPTADINLMNILKTYFNSQIKIKEVITKRKRKPKKKKSTLKSTKNVFVGKGDLKHSNDKVIITFFLYNAEKMYLQFLYKKWKKKLFYPNKPFKRSITEINHPKKKKIIVRSRSQNIYELLASRIQYKLYIKYILFLIKRFNKRMKKLNNKLNTLNKLFNTVLNDKDKLKLLQFLYKFKTFDYPKLHVYLAWILPNFYILAKLKLYIILLNFNKLKHKYSHLCKFIPLIEDIYRKKVVFNIVNLKKRHLNSDIYTQIVSLKLRNRNNKLYRVLRLSLRRIRVPIIYRIKKEKKEKKPGYSDIKNWLHNKLISPFLNFNRKGTNDLDILLGMFFSNYKESSYKKKRKTFSQKNIIISSIKHRKLRGIRVEAKGRLTRRRTAARPLFKMRYIGGLNNIISSIKGWPAIMLRGDHKSNVQYSVVNTNGRNGAFGVKGWVSSRSISQI